MQYLSFLNEHSLEIGNSRGVESNKINEIEIHFHLVLPIAYKEYLLKFGESCDNLFGSYYMTYPSLMDNKSDAIAMVNFDDRKHECDKPSIKDSYYFFGQWQGYIFYFFDCAESNENPAVYILTDSLKIEKYKNSFAEFIYDEGLKPLLQSESPQI
ncbi:SMI1/KNR4 family protein [Flavobacterium davisii]|uniref:SMI1/KNR4 family protein n=1 Tax=Flavobacterium columnare TaxID=996 RepID=A0A8G0KRZ3_9FLAO|nr:SMI1/KNR4 family protein [Flavobacterium davisii]QYS88986.1 SMI1/KNR4 family protein [Flavobacterium davisii]